VTFNARTDTLSGTCSCNVRTVVDGKAITQNFEQVNVSVSIGLYNSPLNEVNQSVWNKIDDVYDDYVDGDFYDLIGKLNEFLSFSQKICDLGQTIMNILRGLRTLSTGWGLISAGLLSGTVTRPAASATSYSNLIFDEADGSLEVAFKEIWQTYLGPYCAFVSCKLAFKWAHVWQEAVATYVNWAYSIGISQYLSGGDSTDGSGRELGDYSWPFGAGHDQGQGDQDMTNPNLNTDNAPYGGSIPQQGSGGDSQITWADNADGTAFDGDLNNYMDGVQYNLDIDGTKVKSSWVLSLAMLCLPGMIYNLNKYREIQCTYGSCLISSSSSGIPSFLCEDNKDYAECRFFWGPIFSLIPFAQFLSDILRTISNILEDPWLLVDTTVNFLCNRQVEIKGTACSTVGEVTTCSYSTTGLFLCLLYDTMSLYTDIAQDIEDMQDDDYWEYEDTGACDTFKDSYDDLEDDTINSS